MDRFCRIGDKVYRLSERQEQYLLALATQFEAGPLSDDEERAAAEPEKATTTSPNDKKDVFDSFTVGELNDNIPRTWQRELISVATRVHKPSADHTYRSMTRRVRYYEPPQFESGHGAEKPAESPDASDSDAKVESTCCDRLDALSQLCEVLGIRVAELERLAHEPHKYSDHTR